MKVLMATKNPGKLQGAKEAFELYFDNVEIEGISANSEVGDQPFNEEILLGAKNRVKNLKEYAKENNLDADYFVASEAGICDFYGQWFDFNCVVIEDKNGYQSTGLSQGFKIPKKYIPEIKETELSKVFDKICGFENSGKGKGGISFITKDKVTRIELTKNAFIMALIEHINGDTWKDN